MQHLILQAIQEKGTKQHSCLNYNICWFHLVAFLKSMLVFLKLGASYHATGWNFDLPYRLQL